MQKFMVFLFCLMVCLTPVTTIIAKNNKTPQGKQKVKTTGETQKPVNAQKKVTICHKGKTITIAEAALPAHLQHGDTLGACAEEGLKSSKSADMSKNTAAEVAKSTEESAQSRVLICHNGHTIMIVAAAVPAHLEQGDTLGACPESTPTSSKAIAGSEENAAEDEEAEEEEEE